MTMLQTLLQLLHKLYVVHVLCLYCCKWQHGHHEPAASNCCRNGMGSDTYMLCRFIWITGWSIWDKTRLRRTPDRSEDSPTLGELLIQKASQGVNVSCSKGCYNHTAKLGPVSASMSFIAMPQIRTSTAKAIQISMCNWSKLP